MCLMCIYYMYYIQLCMYADIYIQVKLDFTAQSNALRGKVKKVPWKKSDFTPNVFDWG